MANKRTKTPANPRVAKRAAPRKKRDLFAELVEGFTELREAREGKRTLRTYVVSSRAVPELKPEELVKLALVASGKDALIQLVKRYPDTVQRLATL